MAGQRNCIKCGTGQTPLIIAGVEVDHCSNCGGIWLDGGEVRQLAQRPADAVNQLREIEAKMGMLSQDVAHPNPHVLETPCPSCGGKLSSAVFGATSLEHCTVCQGIYLDRDELIKTMQLVQTTEATTMVAIARSVSTSGTLG